MATLELIDAQKGGDTANSQWARKVSKFLEESMKSQVQIDRRELCPATQALPFTISSTHLPCFIRTRVRRESSKVR